MMGMAQGYHAHTWHGNNETSLPKEGWLNLDPKQALRYFFWMLLIQQGLIETFKQAR